MNILDTASEENIYKSLDKILNVFRKIVIDI